MLRFKRDIILKGYTRYNLTVLALAIGVLLGCFCSVGQSAHSATVLPGEGVVFEQVDFTFPEATVPDSDWGHISADARTLAKATDMTSGYLNVYTNEGWVIDNLLVDFNGPNPVVGYFTFGLYEPQDVTVLSAYVELSPIPLTEFFDGPRSDFPVGAAEWNAQGAGDENVSEIGPPPPPRIPVIIPSIATLLAEDVECLQSDTENVQCAVNQCAPMSVANSLQFLENTAGITVPHNHVLGLRGDNTLVGQLDETMNRTATSRTSGSGVWFAPMLEGKFEYLVDNGLQNSLENKHQGYGYGQTLPAGDFTHMGITSSDNGATVTWQFICDEICAGEDVELIYQHSTGGHAVRVVGCGNTGGKEWIMYAHDSNQSNDTAGLETVKTNIEDLDNDGTLNLGAASREIVFVLSESVINQPPTCDANGPYTAECAGETTSVSLDGTGSSNPDGDPISYDWTTDCPGGSFDDDTSSTPTLSVDSSNGCNVTCNVSLTVTDVSGLAEMCETSVTIQDTVAPDITCPSESIIDCDESTDPDNTGGATATDDCDSNPTIDYSDVVIPDDCPNEETITRTWTATDYCGRINSCVQIINVVDTTPPEIILSVMQDTLWPPNHKMVDVGLNFEVADNCNTEADISIEVTSDEPTTTAPGAGGSEHAPDAEITDDGRILLRAERSGKGDGRVYVINVNASDECANNSSLSIPVKVNHNKKKDAINSGQSYDATQIN